MKTLIISDDYFYLNGVRSLSSRETQIIDWEFLYTGADVLSKNDVRDVMHFLQNYPRCFDCVFIRVRSAVFAFELYQSSFYYAQNRVVLDTGIDFVNGSVIFNKITFISPRLPWNILKFMLTRESIISQKKLTEQEKTIIRLYISEGSNNKNTAKKIGLSEKTISIHKNNIIKKLGFPRKNNIATTIFFKYVCCEIDV